MANILRQSRSLVLLETAAAAAGEPFDRHAVGPDLIRLTLSLCAEGHALGRGRPLRTTATATAAAARAARIARGFETCQLRTRHWRITDARGRVERVDGASVIGKFPLLRDGGWRDDSQDRYGGDVGRGQNDGVLRVSELLWLLWLVRRPVALHARLDRVADRRRLRHDRRDATFALQVRPLSVLVGALAWAQEARERSQGPPYIDSHTYTAATGEADCENPGAQIRPRCYMRTLN